MDKYSDFKHLSTAQILNRDYRIRIQDLGADISIIAPHGGRIEPGTSWTAKAIAGDRYNYYSFEGIKKKNNYDLHITSHRFDEPQALKLISSSQMIITIHACKDKTDVIYIGGRCEKLASVIGDQVRNLNIEVLKKKRFSGSHPDNICNKGKMKKGVQLEISRTIRDDKTKLTRVCEAIRKAMI